MGLLIFVVLLALLVVLLFSRGAPRESRQGEPDYQMMVDLHAIRRRFDVAHYKFMVRRDAAEARQELRDELHRLDRRRRL